jgi:predicted branched-subunit amino acid permease
LLFIINSVSSIYRTLPGAVLRDIALACLAVWFIGLSYGAIAVASGLPLWVPAMQSILVLAGASEFLFIGIVAAGGNPIAAALAGLLVNARHLPYGLALPDMTGPDMTRPGGAGRGAKGPDAKGRGWRRVLGSHVMNDESVVFALAQDHPDRKRAAYWACGLGVLICWPSGAVLGALAGSAIKDTGAFGLDAMFPAVILALIVPKLRDRAIRRAALAGAAIALAASPFLPAGLPVLLALVGLPVITRRPTDTTRKPTDTTRKPTDTTRKPADTTRRPADTTRNGPAPGGQEDR